MEGQLQSISKIFTEKLYRIPDYQRGYAWGNKQLKDYWNDILQLQDEKNHYVGVLTLESVSNEIILNWDDDVWIIKSKSYAPFYVVDGQQRLTTTIILIQTIIEVIGEEKKINYTPIEDIKKKFIYDSKDDGISRSYIFGYEKDNPSYEFLKTKIFKEKSNSSYREEETIYTHNLGSAKDFFKSQIEALTFPEIEKIYKKVTQHLLFNTYSINSDVDVFIAFETMNNRGKPLSTLELLKNRLIFLSTKFDIEEVERTKLRRAINNAWKAIYHFLGKNKDNPLKDDFFLINHFIVYFGRYNSLMKDFQRKRPRPLYAVDSGDYLLDRVFNIKYLYEKHPFLERLLQIKDVYRYVESLQESVEIWFNINNPNLADGWDDDEKQWLDKLKRIGNSQLAPLLLISYQKGFTKASKIELFKTFEQFAFLSKMVSNYYFSPFQLHNYSMEIMSNDVTALKINQGLREYIDNFKNRTDWKEDLISHFKSYGFYEWTAIKYFLFEYDLHLKEKSKTNKIKINWREYTTEYEDFVTVEHICPQKATSECWKAEFSKFRPSQKKALLNSLGNLLPLSKPKNSSLQNKCFVDKVSNNLNTIGYRFGCYSENEVSKLHKWGPREIKERGLNLLNFLELRWEIQLGTEDDKIKMLNLSFLKDDDSSKLIALL